MITLAQHGLNHPSLKLYIENQDWQFVADWYASIPNNQLSDLSSWMSLQDRVNFYKLGLVRDWYSAFCQQLIDGTNLIPIFGYDQEQIIKLSMQLIEEMNEYGVVAMNLTEAVQNLFRRYNLGANNVMDTLFKLLICLVSSNVFSEYTGLIYFVDMQPYPRWVTMGLANPPTLLDCESELGGV